MIKRKTFGITRKSGIKQSTKNFNVYKGGFHTPAKRATKPKVKRKAKSGTWTLKKADTVFSGIIRGRDKKCMHPRGTENCTMLQNSHFIGRATKSTRFDPDNCVTICWFHHYKSKDLGFEYQKQTVEKHGFDGQYTLFMQKHLGPERFAALMERSKVSIKQNAAIKSFQESLSALSNESVRYQQVFN